MFLKNFDFKLFLFIVVITLNLILGLDKEKHCKCRLQIYPSVVGGSIAKIAWMAIIYPNNDKDKDLRIQNRNYKCSAFVLNENWVITDKKCTEEGDASSYFVGVGTDKFIMWNEKIQVKRIIPNDKVDISLIELEKKIDLDKFEPACIDDGNYQEIKYNSKKFWYLTGAGFGKTHPHIRNKRTQMISPSSPINKKLRLEQHLLKSLNLKDISDSEDMCKEDSSIICVNSEKGRRYYKKEGLVESLCFGDEGSPLHYFYAGYTLVAGVLKDIMSSEIVGDDENEEYCRSGKAVYSKISPHIEWIKANLGNNYCDSKWVDKKLQGLNVGEPSQTKGKEKVIETQTEEPHEDLDESSSKNQPKTSEFRLFGVDIVENKGKEIETQTESSQTKGKEKVIETQTGINKKDSDEPSNQPPKKIKIKI